MSDDTKDLPDDLVGRTIVNIVYDPPYRETILLDDGRTIKLEKDELGNHEGYFVSIGKCTLQEKK